VVITDSNFGDDNVERTVLGDRTELRFATAKTGEQVITAAADAVGLLVQWAPITDNVVSSLPRLKYIVRYGIGLDNIDLVAARRRGIEVRNVDDYCIDEVAAHAAAMILSRSRRLALYDAQVKSGSWLPDEVENPRQLVEDPVGLVGYGRIGRSVARALVGIGYPVAFWDPYVDSTTEQGPAGVSRVDDLADLARSVRHLSLHLPATDQTAGMVDGPILRSLGPDGHLVNTSRGALVDETDLLSCLNAGTLGWASLDVLRTEPPQGVSAQLAYHNRVTVSPHVAYRSTRSTDRLRHQAASTMLKLVAASLSASGEVSQ
jgi:D-3-phosphoglycerate dehydrogenase